MESLEVNKLVRNADKVKTALKVTGDVTIATKELSIVFPEFYIDSGLCDMANDVSVIGIIAILHNGYYSVVNIPIKMTLTPSIVDKVDVDGITYIMCKFIKDDIVIKTNSLVKTTEYLYIILNSFYIKGKIPWYIGYDDVSDFLLESRRYTGSNIGNNFIATDIISSIISYDRKNSENMYRLGDYKYPPVYKGLSNQFHAFDNTTSKLVGAYFSDGVITSIVDKSEEVSNIEEIIRK